MLKNSLALLLIAAAFFCLGSQKVSACGDKFLVVGRGARLQRAYCAIRPATILVYVNPKSERAAAMRDPQFEKALTLAGHKPQIVSDLSKVGELVGAGHFDIVLADFADAAAVERQLGTAAMKPALLPIMYKPSETEITAAVQHFGAILKAPDRITHFLSVIDDVVKARQKGQARKL
jgi:hypothetical protein